VGSPTEPSSGTMRNSWYQLNALELAVGWMAGAGAWFGCFYYLWLLVRSFREVSLVGYALVLFGLCIPLGHLCAMRFHRWGLKLYFWSTVGTLLLYASAGWTGDWMREVTGGAVFWMHTGLLPLHLLLFGLPKVRHLLAHEEPPSEMAEYREPPKPPSYPLVLSAIPGGVLYLLIQMYLLTPF